MTSASGEEGKTDTVARTVSVAFRYACDRVLDQSLRVVHHRSQVYETETEGVNTKRKGKTTGGGGGCIRKRAEQDRSR